MKESDLPSVTRGGVEVGNINVQSYIRQYAERNKEWPYGPIVAKWYPRVEEFKRRFFDGVFKPWDLSRLPSPPIAIEDMRNFKYLGSYRLVPDGYGLSDKLTLNEKHFQLVEGVWTWDYGGDWGLGETIVHEMAHEKHKHKGTTKPAHDKYFRDLLEELGIYCNGYGQHYQPADPDKPFGILMREWGIHREDLPEDTGDHKGSWWSVGDVHKGRSSLTKWTCGCQNAWIGAKEYHATCDLCHNPFVPAETKAAGMLGMVEGSKQNPSKKDQDRKKTVITPEADQAIQDEIDRRRDWAAFYSDNFDPPPDPYQPE